MQVTRSIVRAILAPAQYSKVIVPVAGLKSPVPEPEIHIDEVDIPEKNRLRVMEKQPIFPPGTRTFTMQKRLRDMRGLEEVHNTFMYRQYGIIALSGGRLKHNHMEMIRMTLVRQIDYNRAFAIWRVDAPHFPVSKKSQGQRMGGGKAAVHHYVTPIKTGRVIIEVAGSCQSYEVMGTLEKIAKMLPFKAVALTQDQLDKMKENERRLEEENVHPYTWKYMVQNNMLGCHRWIKPIDKKYFNKCV